MILPTEPDNKKTYVRDKFSSISGKYDLLNSLLSFRMDSYWRWRTVRMLKGSPAGWVLDLCAGTMPLSRALVRGLPGRKVMAVDFCFDMLRAGIGGRAGALPENIVPVCGDGEKIPAASASFHGVTVAFGVRNLGRTMDGLREMHRVLKPGGRLLILEFSRPTAPVIKQVYNFYLNRVLPKVAGLVSGDRDAYEYLASSIAAFYEPAELMRMMEDAGFSGVKRVPLTFGVVSVYVGVRD